MELCWMSLQSFETAYTKLLVSLIVFEIAMLTLVDSLRSFTTAAVSSPVCILHRAAFR